MTVPKDVVKIPDHAFLGGTHPSQRRKIPQTMAAPVILMKIIDSGAMANAANLVKGAVRANRDTQKKAARIFIVINLINKKKSGVSDIKMDNSFDKILQVLTSVSRNDCHPISKHH